MIGVGVELGGGGGAGVFVGSGGSTGVLGGGGGFVGGRGGGCGVSVGPTVGIKTRVLVAFGVISMGVALRVGSIHGAFTVTTSTGFIAVGCRVG